MKLGQAKRETFLEALREGGGHVGRAAKSIGVSRRHLYRIRESDPEFRAAWIEAIEIGTGALEDEAVRRAMQGIDKPIFQGGRKVGTVREYSDTLLMFLLRARNPEKYSDRYRHEHSGPNNGPIQTRSTHAIDLSKVSDEELRVLQGIAARQEPIIKSVYADAFRKVIDRCPPAERHDS